MASVEKTVQKCCFETQKLSRGETNVPIKWHIAGNCSDCVLTQPINIHYYIITSRNSRLNCSFSPSKKQCDAITTSCFVSYALWTRYFSAKKTLSVCVSFVCTCRSFLALLAHVLFLEEQKRNATDTQLRANKHRLRDLHSHWLQVTSFQMCVWSNIWEDCRAVVRTVLIKYHIPCRWVKLTTTTPWAW